MNDPTKELLRMIYVDAKSGCEVVTGLLPKISDDRLRRETAKQLEAYAGYAHRAEAIMEAKNITGIAFPLVSRLTVRGGVMMETVGTTAQTELARLLYDSTRDSAGRMRQAVREYGDRGCDGDVLALGRNMVGFEAEEANCFRTLLS